MKILLACNDLKIAHTLQKGLDENGYDVILAGKSVTPPEISIPFDLIIKDEIINDEQKNTLESWLHPANKNIPMLILSEGSISHDEMENVYESHLSFFEKPFTFTGLVNEIERIENSRSASKKNTILVFHDLMIDVNRRIASRGKVTIPLTSREFDLLKYLFDKIGSLVTLAELAKNIWNVDLHSNQNTLKMYMTYFCQKVNQDKQKLIHTISDSEYSLGTTR